MNPIPQQALSLHAKIEKIVMAGMTIMYAPQTRNMLMSGITSQAPMPQKLAMEVAGLMKIIDGKSPSGLPPETVAPASALLMYELADFIKQSGAGSPTPEDIAAALQQLRQIMVKVFSTDSKAVSGGQPPQAPAAQPMAPPASPPGIIGQQMAPQMAGA